METGDSGTEPAEYDHRSIEAQVRALWEKHDVYRFDPAGTGPVFSVDTPPPYVSASHLHVGHAMSYSQPDFLVRYRRMRGQRVFYPIGFDDNGLPTERYVETLHNVKAADLPRAEFVALCLAETERTARVYEDMWRRLGLSVDWSQRYSTIDRRAQRTAQASFVKLHRAGHLRRANDPILWCPECRTALAQADVEDLDRTSKLHDIAFTSTVDGTPLVIATSRPELLPACVALYRHPGDERYAHLAGGHAKVPLFDYEVPILTDDSVDPDFGTGLMMVCTFGDAEDVLKWRRDGLDLRLAVEPGGRLGPLAGLYAGLQLTQARSAIVAALTGSGALLGSKSIKQTVGVHERCLTPVEFQIRPQWFIAVRERRDRLRQRAAELTWIPPFMKRRLDDWIDGLKWDWNITRQRHYGVPFPVWFCDGCGEAVLAELDRLPVDPLSDQPPAGACTHCGGTAFTGDPDVMDTWMTSSLSAQINDGWAYRDFVPDPALSPMSLRVQAFEIIRTWLFYSLVQSDYHFDRVPWTAVMISGWGLNEQGRKIAKRDLLQSTTEDGYNRFVPDHVMDGYGADALRLWATKARIGADLRYNEKDIRVGRKFTVKLWNVARFIQLNSDPSTVDAPELPPAALTPVDRWLRSHLTETVAEATAAFDAFDLTQAYAVASRFFWATLCDRYIEMIKDRFGVPDAHAGAERDSARQTLRYAFRVVLGLFAPFAPFVTEHLYQRFYASAESAVSLHLTRWPQPEAEWAADGRWRADRVAIEAMVSVLDAVRALRAGHRLGNSARVERLILDPATDAARDLASAIAEPLRTAARAQAVGYGTAAHPSGVPDLTVDIAV